jgi:hypothetical protein
MPDGGRGARITAAAVGLVVTCGLAPHVAHGFSPAVQRSAKTASKPAPANSPAPAARREQPVPFATGETLTYDVSWSSTLTAGTATLRVAEKKPSYNSVAYYVIADGRPSALLSRLYTLYYKVDTLLDVYTLLPQRASVYSEEGKRHRMKTTMYDHAKKTAEYQIETRTVVKKGMPISAVAQDPLGALFVLRSIPLKAGEKITMPLCDNGANYKVLIEAGAVESIKTGTGVLQAQKLTMTPQGADVGARALALWLSTDAARVPVKMSAQLPVGQFVLTLASRK